MVQSCILVWFPVIPLADIEKCICHSFSLYQHCKLRAWEIPWRSARDSEPYQSQTGGVVPLKTEAGAGNYVISATCRKCYRQRRTALSKTSGLLPFKEQNEFKRVHTGSDRYWLGNERPRLDSWLLLKIVCFYTFGPLTWIQSFCWEMFCAQRLRI